MPVLAHEPPLIDDEPQSPISATTLSEADLNQILDQLGGSRSSLNRARGTPGRFTKLN